MDINDYFIGIGTANAIEEKLSNSLTINKANADLLFSELCNHKELLSDDENLVKRSISLSNNNDGEIIYQMMINNNEYFINIKYTTLALVCLLFDITITQGFAAFLFGLLGMDYSLVKLNGMEKCITYKLKEHKLLSLDDLKQSCQCNFTNFSSKCGNLNKDGQCTKWNEGNLIEETIESLVNKKVVKLKGDKYVLIF